MPLPPRRDPLPALSNAGEGPVHAGEKQQEFERQHHGGNNQTQHVARRGVPLVGRATKEFIPAVNVAVRRAYEQGQVAELRLEGREQTNKRREAERWVCGTAFAQDW